MSPALLKFSRVGDSPLKKLLPFSLWLTVFLLPRILHLLALTVFLHHLYYPFDLLKTLLDPLQYPLPRLGCRLAREASPRPQN